MSDYLHQFSIQFSGLSIGKHQFDFQIEDKFFEELGYAEIEHGNVSVQVELEKKTTMLTLGFIYQGNISVACDRCTAPWAFPVNGHDRLIIQFADITSDDSNEDIIYLSRAEFEYNVSQHIYEYLATSLPLRVIPCEITGETGLCNQEILSKLKEMQMSTHTGESNVNPMWEKLQTLKNKSNNK